MQFIRNIEDLITRAAGFQGTKSRVAAVFPHDEHTQEAIADALARSLATFILVGRADELKALPVAARYPGMIEFVDAPDADTAACIAVALVRESKADVLMKGKINTDNLLRAVLNKETGILPRGNVLSHITVSEVPGRDKLLFYTDVAVIPYPTIEQRRAMLGYMVGICRTFGIDCPRIALTHFTEKVNPKFPVSTDYVTLTEEARAGRWGDVIVDGPMDVITAVDPEAGRIKGIQSPIEGRADGLMMADIEAANVFYKTLSHFGHALNAGMLVGTSAPVVLPSRGDSSYGKLASLALACLAAKR